MNQRFENFDPYQHIDTPHPELDAFGNDPEVRKVSRLETQQTTQLASAQRSMGEVSIRIPMRGEPIRRGRHVAESEEL